MTSVLFGRLLLFVGINVTDFIYEPRNIFSFKVRNELRRSIPVVVKIIEIFKNDMITIVRGTFCFLRTDCNL